MDDITVIEIDSPPSLVQIHQTVKSPILQVIVVNGPDGAETTLESKEAEGVAGSTDIQVYVGSGAKKFWLAKSE